MSELDTPSRVQLRAGAAPGARPGPPGTWHDPAGDPGVSAHDLRPNGPALGLGGALVAAALLALSLAGRFPLTAGVLVVQVLLVLGFLALVEAPAAGGVFVLAAAAALAADAVVLLDSGRVAGLAGVAGLAVVAALLHQLLRRRRSRVTESLADTLVAVALVCGAACLPAALQAGAPGSPLRATVLCTLAAAGAALLAGRLGDRVVRRPALAVGSERGLPGLVLALGAGVAGCAVVGRLYAGGLTTSRAAFVGLGTALVVSVADLLVDLAAAELEPGPGDARRVSALRPVGLLLPFALLGPVALVVVRLLAR